MTGSIGRLHGHFGSLVQKDTQTGGGGNNTGKPKATVPKPAPSNKGNPKDKGNHTGPGKDKVKGKDQEKGKGHGQEKGKGQDKEQGKAKDGALAKKAAREAAQIDGRFLRIKESIATDADDAESTLKGLAFPSDLPEGGGGMYSKEEVQKQAQAMTELAKKLTKLDGTLKLTLSRMDKSRNNTLLAQEKGRVEDVAAQVRAMNKICSLWKQTTPAEEEWVAVWAEGQSMGFKYGAPLLVTDFKVKIKNAVMFQNYDKLAALFVKTSPEAAPRHAAPGVPGPQGFGSSAGRGGGMGPDLVGGAPAGVAGWGLTRSAGPRTATSFKAEGRAHDHPLHGPTPGGWQVSQVCAAGVPKSLAHTSCLRTPLRQGHVSKRDKTWPCDAAPRTRRAWRFSKPGVAW